MNFPVTFNIFGHEIYLHMIMEILAFFLGFRYYVWEKRKFTDHIDNTNRLFTILGATIGALIGSRLIGSLEDPRVLLSGNLLEIYQNKTIIGGLLFGLFGVEITKKIIGEKKSTGDLYVLPIIFGLILGRIGCFSMGIYENTYGIPTRFFTGMDLGDGILRHPVSLYEIIYLVILFIISYIVLKRKRLKSGVLFKIFMLTYFGFRFCIEFIKPHDFMLASLSTIQWTCILCFIYYGKFIAQIFSDRKTFLEN